MEKRNQFLKLCISAVIVLAAFLLLSGLIGGKRLYHLRNRGDLGPLTREDISYLDVEAPAASSSDGTVNAADWASVYPYITVSMKANDRNSYVLSYLEQDSYLANIYDNFGFARDYGSARGHEYALEDVAKTERPHALANCLTCKSPNFAKLVNDVGVSVYTMPFDEVYAKMEEDISCYTCHGNDAGASGKLTVTHSYVIKALGENTKTIDAATLSCGQCHIEYYFTPSDKETMMPYGDIESMSPEAILAYYDSMEMPDGTQGFYDWIQPGTNTRMLKAQHPEMETFLSGKHADTLNCADCHMPVEMAEDGTVYHSHELQSPLENAALLSTCAACHKEPDMTAFVRRIQQRVTARETEVGTKLSDLKDALTLAVNEGAMSEEELDAVRALHREAQWFFDFCYVENAEGAHNSDLAYRCLDTAEGKISQAMELLGK